MGRRLVVLVSGSGTNLQALLDRSGELDGDVVLVVSDRPGAGGLERAEAAGVKTAVVPVGDFEDRSAWSAALEQAVDAGDPDLVVLAGFMRILPASFVTRWPVLNVHPSLLPAFPGAHAVEDALAWGAKITGCTVHFVDEEVDHGPIVAQEAVQILPGDTPESLHERIKALEHRLLPECVESFCRGRLSVDGRHVRISS
jgi:phosphoribosylglycinamide formyltransferase-1